MVVRRKRADHFKKSRKRTMRDPCWQGGPSSLRGDSWVQELRWPLCRSHTHRGEKGACQAASDPCLQHFKSSKLSLHLRVHIYNKNFLF